MNRKLLVLVWLGLSLMVYFSWPKITLSQERIFNFDRAYQDYLYNLKQYQTAHREYAEAKNAYLTYQTLTAETEAQQKTISLLRWRDETVRTYLTALRLKLAETTGISSYEQTLLYLKLDEEILWYTNHKQALSSHFTLKEAAEAATVAADHFPQSETLAYQTLGAVLVGKQKVFRDQIQAQINELKAKIGEIRQKGDKQTAIAEKWILEAENKLLASQEKQFAAQQELTPANLKKKNKQTAYNEARRLLRESHQSLQTAVDQLQKATWEIRNAD